jgi:hypothetical protein
MEELRRTMKTSVSTKIRTEHFLHTILERYCYENPVGGSLTNYMELSPF